MFFRLLVVLLLTPQSVNADQNQFDFFHNEILPFKSDGCSQFPDSFAKFDWGECCVEHDLAYWMGGNLEEKVLADELLNKCVYEKAGAAIRALVKVGVNVGGKAQLPTSWHWGYGWVMNRGYKPLSEFESAQVEELVPQDLEEVEVTHVTPIPIRQSITGNYCLDKALFEIGNRQNKEIIRYQVVHESISQVSEGLIKTFKIQTNQCTKPYQAKFSLLKAEACETKVNEWLARRRIRLKSLSFGCEPR